MLKLGMRELDSNLRLCHPARVPTDAAAALHHDLVRGWLAPAVLCIDPREVTPLLKGSSDGRLLIICVDHAPASATSRVEPTLAFFNGCLDDWLGDDADACAFDRST